MRLAVTKRGEDYLSFPQRALFDKLGIRTMVLETDPYGNFLTQGYELASARDWARLGNLYLQDGVWNGERLLPEGYVKFVSTVARLASRPPPDLRRLLLDQRRRRAPRPREAYYMSGAGGQTTLIIPSTTSWSSASAISRAGSRPASLQPRARAAHGRRAEASVTMLGA